MAERTKRKELWLGLALAALVAGGEPASAQTAIGSNAALVSVDLSAIDALQGTSGTPHLRMPGESFDPNARIVLTPPGETSRKRVDIVRPASGSNLLVPQASEGRIVLTPPGGVADKRIHLTPPAGSRHAAASPNEKRRIRAELEAEPFGVTPPKSAAKPAAKHEPKPKSAPEAAATAPKPVKLAAAPKPAQPVAPSAPKLTEPPAVAAVPEISAAPAPTPIVPAATAAVEAPAVPPVAAPALPDIPAPPAPAVVAAAAPLPAAPTPVAPAAPAAAPKPAAVASAAQIPPPPPAAEPIAATPKATVALVFGDGDSRLTETHRALLKDVVSQLTENPDSTVQLLAYAQADNRSKARRLSLSRALAVRSYLLSQDVRNTRIEVRALGDQQTAGKPDRVDVVLQHP